MRLLIDENLSETLVQALGPIFPDSLHVRSLGHGGATDRLVWKLARDHGCILLTRDEDFLQLSVLNGAPPKVILLRTGNCSNTAVIQLLNDRLAVIEEFISHPEASFLALG